MEKSYFKSITFWSLVLLVSVILSAFVLPLFPASMGEIPLNIGFSLIFFSGFMSLEKKNWWMLTASNAAFILEWVSSIFKLNFINHASILMNILLFLTVVFFLIKQIASAREVNLHVILESITGYILMGLVFAGLVAGIMNFDPTAFKVTVAESLPPGGKTPLSEPFYFVFVTFATLGYGDIIPVKPYARSLSTFIGISGQLYIAIIIALLVGKFSSKPKQP